jgi:hypothetical protein
MANTRLAHLQAEALDRAQNGQSFTNFPAIFDGFIAKGIPEADIKPRENVFSFAAWKALGRSVKRGEHGVRIVTFIEVDAKEDAVTGEKLPGYRKPHTSVVFHISQTEPTQAYEHRRFRRRDRAYARDYVRDPGEDAEDRWNEVHGDR